MYLLLIIIVVSMLVFLLLSILNPPNQILEKINSMKNMLPFFNKKRNMPVLFKTWAEKSLKDEPELQTWLLSLPAEGLELLTDKIQIFCTDISVDLAWVVAPDADEVTPDMTQKTEKLVIDYCNLYLKGLQNAVAE